MPSQVLQGVSWGTARAWVPSSLKGQWQNSQVPSCRSQSCQGCVTASRVCILGKPAPFYRLEICACPSSPSFQQCFAPNYIAQFCAASDFLSYQNVSQSQILWSVSILQDNDIKQSRREKMGKCNVPCEWSIGRMGCVNIAFLLPHRGETGLIHHFG